jgi:hypothetical protein
MVLLPPREDPKAPSSKRKRERPRLVAIQVVNPARPKHHLLRQLLQNVKKKSKLLFLASEDDLEGKLKKSMYTTLLSTT